MKSPLASFHVRVALVAMAAGSFALCVLPAVFGVAGYVVAIAVLTPGYQLFQAANNTAVMQDVPQDRRGVVSGMLNLARNAAARRLYGSAGFEEYEVELTKQLR